MKKREMFINTEYIELNKLLKVSWIVESGGQAFMIIVKWIIKVNGNSVSEKRKKIRPKDIVNINGKIELTVSKEKNENK